MLTSGAFTGWGDSDRRLAGREEIFKGQILYGGVAFPAESGINTATHLDRTGLQEDQRTPDVALNMRVLAICPGVLKVWLQVVGILGES